MDKTTLVEADLETGRKLIQELEKRGIPIDVAAWLLEDESRTWQLLLSSPTADKFGPRPVLQAVSATLRQLDVSGVDLDDVLVASPRESLVKDLTRLVRTGDELQMLKLHDLELGARFFRSSRIYRARGDRGPDGWIEDDARVRVKATGQFGVVRGVRDPTGDRRYFVLFDLTPDDLNPLLQDPPRKAGGYFAERELEFLYAVRPGGWVEKPPVMARSG